MRITLRIIGFGSLPMLRPRRALPSTAKKAVNLSIPARLLEAARAAEINLSATLERALEDALRQVQRAGWLAEIAAGMAAFNAQVDEHGVFADTLRSF